MGHDEITFVKKIIKATLVFPLLILGFGCWFVVGPGQVGVTFNNLSGGTKTHQQGFHLKLPIITRLVKFDVKTQREDVHAEAASKDIQRVTVHAVLNYHLAHDKVNTLYTTVGPDFVEKIIHPAVNETAKAATAQFPVEEIIVKRDVLKNQIEVALEEKLKTYDIVLESLNLVDIKFSDDFNKVVEDKQIEEQKIKTAEYQKRQAIEYKEKTILEAQADAERQRLMRQTVTEDIVALEWIKKWDGTLPTTVMGDAVPMVNINKGE